MNRHISNYKIVTSVGSISKLESCVVDLIKEGWEPIGGVCAEQGRYYQAMARYSSSCSTGPR